jgi:hypothetical protein
MQPYSHLSGFVVAPAPAFPQGFALREAPFGNDRRVRLGMIIDRLLWLSCGSHWQDQAQRMCSGMPCSGHLTSSAEGRPVCSRWSP